MTETFRVQIDRKLLTEAEHVAEELGTTPGEVVRLLFAQMVKLRALPFRPSEFPALDEYGVSLDQATAVEDAAIEEIESARHGGKLVEFKGKL